MASLTLSGSLSFGELCGPCNSPGDLSIPLTSTCNGIPAGCAPFVPLRRVSVTPPSWLALGEVGPTASVTKGLFLYMRTDSPISIRMTVDDGAGGSVLQVIDLDSPMPFMKSFPTAKFLKLLEVQGSATITYLVSGSS